MTAVPPTLTSPLVSEPVQSSPAAPTTALGPLEHLIGTWTNQDIHGRNKGGQGSPFSYNVMPLPQAVSPTDPLLSAGYILKNFSYYEEITFSAIHGTAPNRGGLGTQVANTLFYEQRVYFAEGPDKDMLVHAENGSLLYLTGQQQLNGPYGPGILPGSEAPVQTSTIVKQASVPHGNSILTYGGHSVLKGPITFPEASPLPEGVDTTLYTTPTSVADGNPNVHYTLNYMLPLSDALKSKQPVQSIKISVNTNPKNPNEGGSVTNIPFEQKHCEVTNYSIDYWLESFVATGSMPEYTQLQYVQIIDLTIPIQGKKIVFPHTTTNTLTKLS